MPTIPALRKYVLIILLLALFFFSIYFWKTNVTCFATYQLREYGELLISCGIVGEALDIFKDLELWDNLIYCYRYASHLK